MNLYHLMSDICIYFIYVKVSLSSKIDQNNAILEYIKPIKSFAPGVQRKWIFQLVPRANMLFVAHCLHSSMIFPWYSPETGTWLLAWVGQQGALLSNGLSTGDAPLLVGWRFPNWTDYNGVAFSGIFSKVIGMGSHFFGTLRARKSFI